jgi:membrane associated rhomboid family serine protease
MIGDRHYMRERPDYGRPSLTVQLMAILIACFIVQNLILYYTGFNLFKWLALTESVLHKGWVWQLFTFQFLHAPLEFGGFVHIFFNCLVLYYFGTALETAMSAKQFLTLYFGSGAAGGLFHCLGNLFFPGNFPGHVVGASAGIEGLVAAFCFIYAGQQVLLFYVLPIPTRFLFIFSMLFSAFGILVPVGANAGVAHGAHLGGLLAGYAYVRWILNSNWQMPTIKWPFRRNQIIISTSRSTFRKPRPMTGGDVPAEEFISKEVDPILDKITKHGIHSLTEAERKTLEAARARMAKR